LVKETAVPISLPSNTNVEPSPVPENSPVAVSIFVIVNVPL
jgi:hypothetical protein